MEGLKVSNANLVVYVHPSKSKEVSQVVLRELSSLLFRFSEIFDGVVLAYDVNSLDKCAKILPGVHPYFGVRLKANLLLFSPKPDMLLEGKVVKLSQESIHVVVLGFSSAIIVDKDIRGDFKYKTKHGQDVYASKSHKRHVIKVGTMIRFLVKRQCYSNHPVKWAPVPILINALKKHHVQTFVQVLANHTGSIHWLDKNMEFVSNIDRSAMKRGSEGEPIMLEQGSVSGKPSTLDSVQKVKKSKKQKIREES